MCLEIPLRGPWTRSFLHMLWGLLMEMATYLGFPAPLSALQVPQGLEMYWVLLGHPCLQRGLGNLGLHGHQHL